MFLNFLLIVLLLFMSVAFYTIMERKILGIFHLRLGPNKSLILGIFQPFYDAIKLFSKNSNILSKINEFFWNFSPIMTFCMFVLILMLIPIKMENNKMIFNLIIFILMIGIPTFTIFWSSLFSFSKFSIISSKRCITQMISYEMGIMIMLIIFMPMMMSMNITEMNEYFSKIFLLKFFIMFMMMILITAETSRIPFDFIESESELISGFNIEFSSCYFSLFFIYEYGMMIFFSLFFSIMFSNFYFSFLIIYLFIHLRSSFPRFRYDQMMIFFWKFFYPILLCMLMLMKIFY